MPRARTENSNLADNEKYMTVIVEIDLFEQFKDVAESHERSVSGAIRQLMKEFVERNEGGAV